MLNRGGDSAGTPRSASGAAQIRRAAAGANAAACSSSRWLRCRRNGASPINPGFSPPRSASEKDQLIEKLVHDNEVLMKEVAELDAQLRQAVEEREAAVADAAAGAGGAAVNLADWRTTWSRRWRWCGRNARRMRRSTRPIATFSTTSLPSSRRSCRWHARSARRRTRGRSASGKARQSGSRSSRSSSRSRMRKGAHPRAVRPREGGAGQAV